jgi:hypothetical protein
MAGDGDTRAPMNLRERGRQYEQMNRNNRNALGIGGGGSYGQGGGNHSNEYTQDMLMQQNDGLQEDLLMKAQQLRMIVTDIHSEVGEHNKVLGDMQNNMGKTDTLLGRTLGKLTDMGSSGGSKHMCYMALFFMFMVFLLYWTAIRKS